jgi:hypothetical protein
LRNNFSSRNEEISSLPTGRQAKNVKSKEV